MYFSKEDLLFKLVQNLKENKLFKPGASFKADIIHSSANVHGLSSNLLRF
jgi:hypothetical protein